MIDVYVLCCHHLQIANNDVLQLQLCTASKQEMENVTLPSFSSRATYAVASALAFLG